MKGKFAIQDQNFLKEFVSYQEEKRLEFIKINKLLEEKDVELDRIQKALGKLRDELKDSESNEFFLRNSVIFMTVGMTVIFLLEVAQISMRFL